MLVNPRPPQVSRRSRWTKVILLILGLALITAILRSSSNTADLNHNKWQEDDDDEDYFDMDEQPQQPQHKTFIFKKIGKWVKKKIVNPIKKKFDKGKLIPPRGLPDAPFKFFLTISMVTYGSTLSEQRKRLRDMGYGYLQRVKCTEHKKWKLCAYKDPRKKRLYFSFRGSKHINNYLHDANKVFGGRQMNRIIGHFNSDVSRIIRENPKYFPYAFCGHSAGGFFADRVLTSRKVWRATVNGFKVKNGEYNINVRTKGDPVSVSPFSKRNRYITIAKGGHSWKNFKGVMNKPWKSLSSVFAKLRVVKLPGQPRPC